MAKQIETEVHISCITVVTSFYSSPRAVTVSLTTLVSDRPTAKKSACGFKVVNSPCHLQDVNDANIQSLAHFNHNQHPYQC